MYKKDRVENLRNNIRYLMKSRGETRLSLCNASGLTRTTIYNILEGRVVNVQQSTIRKISDFFGIAYQEIETVDLERREVLQSRVPLPANSNPLAVPIIRERSLLGKLDRSVGELVVSHPLTYYFGEARNLIGVLLDNGIQGVNESGDLLIVRKGASRSEGQKLVYDRSTQQLLVRDEVMIGSATLLLVGDIIEERFNG